MKSILSPLLRPFAMLAVALAPLLALSASGPALAQGDHIPARACVPGERAIIAHVRGFKSNIGKVRAQLYGPDPDDFLASGKWVTRIERRRDGQERMTFCFPVPAPGRYAIAVRHDANDNGHSDWNDGGGFSRNPGLSVFNMKPKFSDTAVEVRDGPVTVEIVMQYRSGLSIRPVRD